MGEVAREREEEEGMGRIRVVRRGGKAAAGMSLRDLGRSRWLAKEPRDQATPLTDHRTRRPSLGGRRQDSPVAQARGHSVEAQGSGARGFWGACRPWPS